MTLLNEKNVKIEADGFGSRVQRLMDFAGLKKYGRGRLITGWSGLSESTASYLFKNDRAPRDDGAIQSIVAGLDEAIKIGRDVEVKRSDLLDYLMMGKGFKELDIWVRKAEGIKIDVFDSEVKRLKIIHAALVEMDVMLEKDSGSSDDALKEIIKRLVKFVEVNDLDYESESVYAFIKDMVMLYKNGKLRIKT